MAQNLPFFIIMAVLGEIAILGLTSAARSLRISGGKSRAVYGAMGLSAVIWVPLACYFLQVYSVNISPYYLLALVAWVAINYGLAFGSRFLSGLQGASEATSYRFALSVVLAIILDLTIFHVSFTPKLWTVIGLLAAGGVLLHVPRKTGFEAPKGGKSVVPLKLKAGVIVLGSVLDISAFALFKFAAQSQGNVLVHNALFQAALGIVFLIAGCKTLKTDVRQNYMPVVCALLIAVLAIIASSANAYAVTGLPLSLFVMFSLIRGMIAKVRDINDINAKPHPAFIASFVMIAVGLITLSVFGAL
jgi:hypothetical protein